MDSVLRPRDIQARIRAGETPEDVAAAAQTSVDKIMGFATPVLAERAYQAQLAQRASVRRRAATGHVPNLGAAVSSHLERLEVDPTEVEWDSWRREDGRWTVVAAYVSRGEHHQAAFTYDAAGRFVVADDDEARVLVGERTAAAEVPTDPPGLEPAGNREATPEPLVDPAPAAAADWIASTAEPEVLGGHGDQLPLGDDAIDLVTGRRREAPEPHLSPVPRPAAQPEARYDDQPATQDTAQDAAQDDAAPAELQGEVTLDLTDTSRAVRSAGSVGATADADWISTQASERPEAAQAGHPRTGSESTSEPAPEPDAPRPDGAPQSEPWDSPGDDGTVEGDAREEEAQESDALFEAPATAQRQPRSTRSRGRASVPSWDEIMFGTSSSE